MKFDKVVLLAKNKSGEVISACKWGKVWYFIYENKKGGGRIGESYKSLTELLSDAKGYILHESGYNFKESDLTSDCKRVQLTKEQRVAINMAIRLLEDSDSDHSEQCVHYLKTI